VENPAARDIARKSMAGSSRLRQRDYAPMNAVHHSYFGPDGCRHDHASASLRNTAGPFDSDCKRLAYSIDAGRGERDYRDVFAEPVPCVLAALRGSRTVSELDHSLPPDRD
jgi:hypothetical protein